MVLSRALLLLLVSSCACVAPFEFDGGTCETLLAKYGVCVERKSGVDVTPYEIELTIDSFLMSAANMFGHEAEVAIRGLRIVVHDEPFPCGDRSVCGGTYLTPDNVIDVWERDEDCFGITAIHHELLHAVEYNLYGTHDGLHLNTSLYEFNWNYCGAWPLETRAYFDACWDMCNPDVCEAKYQQLQLNMEVARNRESCI